MGFRSLGSSFSVLLQLIALPLFAFDARW